MKCAFYAPENVHKTNLFPIRFGPDFVHAWRVSGGSRLRFAFFSIFGGARSTNPRVLKWLFGAAPRACAAPTEDKIHTICVHGALCIVHAVCCVLCAVCCAVLCAVWCVV